MTISDISNVKTYTGDGASASFSTVFSFFDSTDLVVTIDDVVQVLNTDYTVSGGSGVVGTVQFVAAPASSAAIVISRDAPYNQETDFANFDGNPSDVTENQFDKVVMQTQQINNAIDRGIQVPIGTSGYSPDLTISGQGGRFLQLKSDLSGFTFSTALNTESVTISAYGETLIDDTDASTARTTLELGTIATTDLSFTASKYGAVAIQNNDDDALELITSQGTSGQVLTSTGSDSAPTWQDSPGVWVLLETQTANADSSIDFTSNIDSTYRAYVVQGTSVRVATDNVDLELLASGDGGSSWLGGTTYEYQCDFIAGGSSDLTNNSTGTSKMILTKGQGNAISENTSFELHLYRPSSSTDSKLIKFNGTFVTAGSSLTIANCHGAINVLGGIDAIRIIPSSGNITVGTFKLYGIN